MKGELPNLRCPHTRQGRNPSGCGFPPTVGWLAAGAPGPVLRFWGLGATLTPQPWAVPPRTPWCLQTVLLPTAALPHREQQPPRQGVPPKLLPKWPRYLLLAGTTGPREAGLAWHPHSSIRANCESGLLGSHSEGHAWPHVKGLPSWWPHWLTKDSGRNSSSSFALL